MDHAGAVANNGKGNEREGGVPARPHDLWWIPLNKETEGEDPSTTIERLKTRLSLAQQEARHWREIHVASIHARDLARLEARQERRKARNARKEAANSEELLQKAQADMENLEKALDYQKRQVNRRASLLICQLTAVSIFYRVICNLLGKH